MPSTAALLTRYETCARAGYWARLWEREKLDGTTMLARAIETALCETKRVDIGELAGETVLDLAEQRGLETKVHDVYTSAVHHAALADIVTQAIRPENAQDAHWSPVEPLGDTWLPSCFIDAKRTRLRRIVLASSWSDERHYHEIRSWYAQGEAAHYGLPMQQVVVVLGQLRDGRRHGPWTKGFMHPNNSGNVRFRRKHKSSYSTFNANWRQIWREDVGGELPVAQWLQGMLTDDILHDVLFTVDVPVPSNAKQLCAMAAGKLAGLRELAATPDGNLSTCYWPAECVFRPECHADRGPSRARFVQLDA